MARKKRAAARHRIAGPGAGQGVPRHQDEEIRRFLARVVGSDAWRAEVEDRVVRLTNAERAKHRMPPLRIDERPRTAARRHGADMARRGFFAHQCPSGLEPADRMRAHGHPRPGGENIARASRSRTRWCWRYGRFARSPCGHVCGAPIPSPPNRVRRRGRG
ncbi:CAP domain-containing protein [Allokutzneria sp. A3M-2-11 16]|uniref:CAP domain-containing protein n=1 Tax=Allokutzneria sp. A3M-2-11 16 TaxID=2962043 RepID=UPI0020B6FBCC|nr:CAP domain-containing protein [Allokutzneria sp. A3M-2-11 16]MCP3801942.1 CAP domain-containing protein [Allokutzneria sp. A3M-2-11 16]